MANETLSTRGRRALQPPLSYFGKHFEGMTDMFSPDNPNGYVLLAVAENKVTYEMARERLAQCRALSTSAGGYDNMCGRQVFRSALARFMTRTMLNAPSAVQHSGVAPDINPEHVIAAAGCGALLNQLAFSLLEAGEGILLPTPTYGALYNDFGVLAQNVVIDVPANPTRDYRLTVDDLDAARDRAAAHGVRARMLVLINPNNPLGIVHTEKELVMMIEWCRAQRVHLVVDEIYAHSVYNVQAAGVFTSALRAAYNLSAATTTTSDAYLGDYVHVMWGFSKDFCMSGYRVGVLVTQNAALRNALGGLNYFSAVSNDTQEALAALISDDAWTDAFLEHNREFLRRNAALVMETVERLGLKYTVGGAGMFLWLDLRPLLEHHDGDTDKWAAERRLLDDLYSEARLLMTPGEACHAAEGGYFRCCFAWVTAEALTAGFKRLESFISKRNISVEAWVPRAVGPEQAEAQRKLRNADPMLGMRVDTIERKRGAYIAEMNPAGQAAAAGLQQGDYIMAVAGEPVENVLMFQKVMEKSFPGQRLEFTVQRDGKECSVQVTVAARTMSIQQLAELRAAAGEDWCRQQETLRSSR